MLHLLHQGYGNRAQMLPSTTFKSWLASIPRPVCQRSDARKARSPGTERRAALENEIRKKEEREAIRGKLTF